MCAARLRSYGWLVLLLVGCDGILPPPPPPKTRTAPALPATTSESNSKPSSVPRGPDSAPEHFKVKFETSKGDVVVDVHRHWAGHAADRFYQLVKEGYYDGNRFFRVAANPKIVQFGLNGDPEITAKYLEKGIPDEPRTQSNVRGTLAFAKSSQPNSRTTQLFINTGDNSQGLDQQGFAPFGKIIEGLEEAVDQITNEYGEEPNQGTIMQAGNTYLEARFPNLDYIIKATILSPDGKPVDEAAAPKQAAPEAGKPAEPQEAQTNDEKAKGNQ